MDTFSEEIVNGKFNFFSSGMRFSLRKISQKKGFVWPVFLLVRILSFNGKILARENPDYGIFYAVFAETNIVQCFSDLGIDLLTCISVESFRLYKKSDENKIHKKIVIASRIVPWDSPLQSSVIKQKSTRM